MVALLLALAIAAGCARGDGDDPTLRSLPPVQEALGAGSASTTTAPLPASNGADPMVAPGETEVLDAGAAPHVELRYRPSAGDQWHLQHRMQQRSVTEVADRRASAVLEMELQQRLEVTDVDDQGGYLLRTSTEAVALQRAEGLAPGEAQALVDGLGDMGTEVRFGDRGQVIESAVTGGRDPALRDFADQLGGAVGASASFIPTAPVGVGATWRHTAVIDFTGLGVPDAATEAVTTCELVELDEPRYRVRCEQVMRLDPVDLPDGTTMGQVAEATMELVGSTRAPVPVDAELSQDQTVTLEAPDQGTMTTEITLHSQQRLEPDEP